MNPLLSFCLLLLYDIVNSKGLQLHSLNSHNNKNTYMDAAISVTLSEDQKGLHGGYSLSQPSLSPTFKKSVSNDFNIVLPQWQQIFMGFGQKAWKLK